MSKKLNISIDITDWRDEMQRVEPRIVQTDDDVISLVVDDGYSMVDAGKIAVVQEEMGLTETPVLVTRKMMIKSAARSNVNTIVASRKRTVETESGREYEVREFVAVSRTKDDGDESDLGESPVVTFDSGFGLNRCVHYLRHVVPGHVWSRLVQIHGAGGDVGAAAEELKMSIEEMVGRLE